MSTIHVHTPLMNIALLANSPFAPLCARFLFLCVMNHPFLLTWKSPSWWLWCKCQSTLVPGWWSTAHPLLPTLPLPFQRLSQFMLHVFRDDITTSVTLSDTLLSLLTPCKYTVYCGKVISMGPDYFFLGGELCCRWAHPEIVCSTVKRLVKAKRPPERRVMIPQTASAICAFTFLFYTFACKIT